MKIMHHTEAYTIFFSFFNKVHAEAGDKKMKYKTAVEKAVLSLFSSSKSFANFLMQRIQTG